MTLVTPTDPAVSAGIVCFDVPGVLPGNAVLSLREQGVVASATPYAHVVHPAGAEHRHQPRAGRRGGGGSQLALSAASARVAARKPHMPWTPAPGGVDDEHR